MLRIGLCVLVAIALGGTAWLAVGASPQLIAVGYLAGATPWLFSIDVREHRLPNQLVLPGIGAGLVSCAGEWLASGRPVVPLVAGAAYASFLGLLHLLGGMGMGDVKLGAALGLASWSIPVAVLAPVIAFLVGGLVAVAMLIAGRRGAKIAFGPYLLGGYWVAVALIAVARA